MTGGFVCCFVSCLLYAMIVHEYGNALMDRVFDRYELLLTPKPITMKKRDLLMVE